MYIASMDTFPASLDFHPVNVGSYIYNPTAIHRISNDGLTIYGVNDSGSDQLTKFSRPNTSTYLFTAEVMSSVSLNS